MLVGYARVSTVDQDTALQLDSLRAAGVSRIYSEAGSGVGPRPELQRALREVRKGDVLVVWKLDRLARSLADLLAILTRLNSVGAAIKSLTEPIDTATPLGAFVVQILGAVAQLERAIIIQRTTAGIRAARDRGVQWGRRPVIPAHERQQMLDLVASGLRVTDVARAYGVSRAAVYSFMSRSGD